MFNRWTFLDYVYRDRINPLLSTEGLKQSIQNTIIKNKSRCQESENIGEPVYSVTAYRNIKRATMILDEKLLLLISFERKIDEYQTMQKILNYLKKTDTVNIIQTTDFIMKLCESCKKNEVDIPLVKNDDNLLECPFCGCINSEE